MIRPAAHAANGTKNNCLTLLFLILLSVSSISKSARQDTILDRYQLESV